MHRHILKGSVNTQAPEHIKDYGGKHLTIHLHAIMLSPHEGCWHASL